MTYVPRTSRHAYTNPKTPAQVRATLAKLLKGGNDNAFDITDLTEIVELLQSAGVQTSEADTDILTGQVVRQLSTGNIDLARANAIGTADVAGMALEDIASGAPGRWAPLGVVSKTGWGLTPGADYYLSAGTAGEIVATPDSTAVGSVVIMVGKALSSEKFLFNPSQGILL